MLKTPMSLLDKLVPDTEAQGKVSEKNQEPFEFSMEHLLEEVASNDFLNDLMKPSRNLTTFANEAFEKIKSIKSEEIISEINKQSQKIPYLHESINNTQNIISNILPLDQIESDVTKVAKYLLDNSSSLPEKVLNTNPDHFQEFFLFHHLKNASDSLGEIKIPGFPSVKDLAEGKS